MVGSLCILCDAMASSSPTSSKNEIEKLPIDAKLEQVAELDTSGIDEKKLVRKLDWALVPWVGYSFIQDDRSC